METAINYTLTSLKRWSCVNSLLPPPEKIKDIHVYDFDNTLFKSPLPNRALWDDKWRGKLGNPDIFVNGGWFHDLSILAATGEGIEIEEPRAWEGWWNEKVVNLVRLSIQQEDCLTVLLTGRAESSFQDIIGRICKSKGLVFDMMCLKPSVGPNNEKFSSTMAFKQVLLGTLVRTYQSATSIRIYEDRESHVRGFEDWVISLNEDIGRTKLRAQMKGEVIHVVDVESYLDPIAELATIQRMINRHNEAILSGSAPTKSIPLQLSKIVLYTAYQVIHGSDTDHLRSFIPPEAHKPTKKGSTRFLGNSIIITPHPAPYNVLKKVGGLGAKVVFQVTEIGSLENRIWAARVQTTDKSQAIWHADGPHKPASIVLAIRPGTKPSEVRNINKWEKVPKEKTFAFETEVREYFRLTIDQEPDPSAPEHDIHNQPPTHAPSNPANQPRYTTTRKHALAPNTNRANQPADTANQPPSRPPSGPASFQRRGSGQHRPSEGGRRGGGGSGRGRGGHHGGSGRGGYAARGGGPRTGYRDYDAQGTGREKENDSGMYNAY
jgi:HAD domain family 1 in Swiss Army Knife RNA repair proteins